MGKSTGIEWCDSTWNPIRGCSRVSEGCRNCYAETVAARFSGPGRPYAGLATFKIIGEGTPREHVEAHWTGEVRFVEKHLHDPLSWKTPAKIFVNSMSDLFHPGVQDEWLAEIFDVMARARQHTYLVLTKRPERMREALLAASAPEVATAFERTYGQEWPPKNWFFGISVEDQDTASRRLKALAGLDFEPFNLFVSYEPALGPVNWFETDFADIIDWLIVGGESGPRARPMHPDWARAAREFCQFAGIPFFFKQWGEFIEMPKPDPGVPTFEVTGPPHECCDGKGIAFDRVGKHKAGSHLDGVEWKEFPNVDRVSVS